MKTIYWVIIAVVLYIFINKKKSGFGKGGGSSTGSAYICNKSPLLDSSDKDIIKKIAENHKGYWSPPSGSSMDYNWWSNGSYFEKNCKKYYLGSISFHQGVIKKGTKPILIEKVKNKINEIAKKHGGTWIPKDGWDGNKIRLGYIEFN